MLAACVTEAGRVRCSSGGARLGIHAALSGWCCLMLHHLQAPTKQTGCAGQGVAGRAAGGAASGLAGEGGGCAGRLLARGWPPRAARAAAARLHSGQPGAPHCWGRAQPCSPLAVQPCSGSVAGSCGRCLARPCCIARTHDKRAASGWPGVCACRWLAGGPLQGCPVHARGPHMPRFLRAQRAALESLQCCVTVSALAS